MIPNSPPPETDVVEVSTGEVKLLGGYGVLSAGAIGSCIAVAVFDQARACGGIAHVMLPGRARKNADPLKTRYAEDAIEELLAQLSRCGADPAGMKIYLVGAGNVLERPDDTVCEGNIASVTGTLKAHGLTPCAVSLGGIRRRRVRLYLPSGRIECAIGDGAYFILNDGGYR